MSFAEQHQPFPLDVGHLALGACAFSLDTESLGHFHSAEFIYDATSKIVKSGYPAKPRNVFIDSARATCRASFDELGGPVKTYLQGILSSLANDDGPPTYDIAMKVFRPRGNDVDIAISGAALLQQFELSLGYDFNQVKLDFEALVPDPDQTLSDVLSFTATGNVTYSAPSWLINKGNVSVGFPKIRVGGVSAGSLQAANIRLSTNYKRIEAGYPRLLRALIPVESVLEIDFVSEEFTATALDNGLVKGTISQVIIDIPLYDGTAMTLTVPTACLVGSSPKLNQEDWSGMSYQYVGITTTSSVASIS